MNYRDHVDYGGSSQDYILAFLDYAAKQYDEFINRMKVTGSDANPES